MNKFSTIQFTEMPKPTKADLIVKIINDLNNGIFIKIDQKEINTTEDFVSWLIDNL